MCSDNYILDLLIMLHNLAMKSIVNHILKSIISEHISMVLSPPLPSAGECFAERVPDQAAPRVLRVPLQVFWVRASDTCQKTNVSCHIIPPPSPRPRAVLVPAVAAALGERCGWPRVPGTRGLRAAASPARGGGRRRWG